MKELSAEKREYAVTALKKIVDKRGLSQKQLEELSGVGQSTISKIFSRSIDPTYDVLKKLYQAAGLTLTTVLHDSDDFIHDLLGYMATPLTGVVHDPKSESELQRIVLQIKEAAQYFRDPAIELYWPGDHTHPVRNPNFTPPQVYLTDRSRASTHDFIVLFCAAPSYGVGQENEIATQAGLPAIRIMPRDVSRMMSGSFIHSTDIQYDGSLETGVSINESELRSAFDRIRKAHFRHRALYKNMNGNEFGKRLRKLIDERCGDYQQIADELGLSLSYLHAMMDEQVVVSNPSLRLLRRLAIRLGAPVAFLIGDSEEADPIWIETDASWRKWICNPSINAADAMHLRDEWRREYDLNRVEHSAASFRRSFKALTEIDWDLRYQKLKKAGDNGTQRLF